LLPHRLPHTAAEGDRLPALALLRGLFSAAAASDAVSTAAAVSNDAAVLTTVLRAGGLSVCRRCRERRK